jgi:hypothetical protein
MKCKKCDGTVCVDRVFSHYLRLELFCINCGKRWMIRKNRNAFSEWLTKMEDQFEKSLGIFS